MKLGIIISIYNGMEFLKEFLEPWIEARKQLNIKIVFVDAKFENFDGELNSTDGTTEYLVNELNCGLIDYYGHVTANRKEGEIRNNGIGMLLSFGCTHILSTAPDEIFTLKQIQYIYDYLEKDESNAFFRLEYKNYVGDRNSYILGFKPKRIWKVDLGEYRFNGLVFDDDGSYYDLINNRILLDDIFPSITIPDIKINHYSWLDNKRSQDKINYQLKRGWQCSYLWNERENKIEFNKDYYRNNNKELPVIYKNE